MIANLLRTWISHSLTKKTCLATCWRTPHFLILCLFSKSSSSALWLDLWDHCSQCLDCSHSNRDGRTLCATSAAAESKLERRGKREDGKIWKAFSLFFLYINLFNTSFSISESLKWFTDAHFLVPLCGRSHSSQGNCTCKQHSVIPTESPFFSVSTTFFFSLWNVISNILYVFDLFLF